MKKDKKIMRWEKKASKLMDRAAFCEGMMSNAYNLVLLSLDMFYKNGDNYIAQQVDHEIFELLNKVERFRDTIYRLRDHVLRRTGDRS